MSEIGFDDFLKVDIRVGTVVRAEPFPRRASPRSSSGSISGRRSGRRKAPPRSRRITRPRLVGRQVMAVVNFPPRQIGPMRSEVLVLGVSDAEGGIVLLAPDQRVANGERMH
jgi:tRNA-binding protein